MTLTQRSPRMELLEILERLWCPPELREPCFDVPALGVGKIRRRNVRLDPVALKFLRCPDVREHSRLDHRNSCAVIVWMLKR